MTTDQTLTEPALTEPAAASDDALRAAAVRRLHRKREFVQHLVSYLIVNTLLVTVWLVLGLTVGFWFPWPLFPIAGWGIGLAFHAWATFGPPSRPISDEAIAREMQRLSKR
jgi:fatty acid desaturase